MNKRIGMILIMVAASLLLGGCGYLQGDDGKTGPIGPQGPIGPDGPPGTSAADELPFASCLSAPCIIEAHIADGAVDARVLGPNSVGAAQIAGAQVGGTAIGPGAVTNVEFDHTEAPPLVGSGQMAETTLIGPLFADTAIKAGHVSDGAVLPGNVAPNAVGTAQVISGALHNFWISPPPWAAPNNDFVIGTAGACSDWVTIDRMSVTTDNAKGGAYLAVFNGSIDSDYLDPLELESAWVRLVVDGHTLSSQSIASNNDVVGTNYHSVSLFGVVQLDNAPHSFEVQWNVCEDAQLQQFPDTHGGRSLTVIEFAKTEVRVKP